MSFYTDNNVSTYFSHALRNKFSRCINRNPKLGKLAGWAFGTAVTAQMDSFTILGTIDTIALTTFTLMRSPFSAEARHDLGASLKTLKELSIRTAWIPVVFPFAVGLEATNFYLQVNFDKEKREGWKEIHFAVLYGDLPKLQSLLLDTKNVDLIGTYRKGNEIFSTTPLHLASGACPEIIEALVKAGADPFSKNNFNHNPLEKAIVLKDLITVKALLKHYYYCFNERYLTSLLYLALEHSDFAEDLYGGAAPIPDSEIIEVLVGYGANVHHLSLLDAAVRNNSPDGFLALIKHGTNFNERDDMGFEPIHYVLRVRFLKGLEILLLQESVHVNIRDDEGLTPLLYLASQDNSSLKFMKALIEDSRLEPDILDNNARSALLIAYIENRLSKNHDQILKVLEDSQKFDRTIPDYWGKTISDYEKLDDDQFRQVLNKQYLESSHF